MKDTYLKYIETAEVLDEGPPSGETRLQHVSVVSVVDQNGDEWFPDPSVPIAVVTEAYYDPANVYKWGETVKATTATFTGDDRVQPMNIWARWQYRLNGEENFTDAEKFEGLDNKPVEIEGIIPMNTTQLKFFTSCKEQGDTPDTQEFISSVLGVQDVLQLDPTVTSVSPQNIVQVESGNRVRLDCYAEFNYIPVYYWQFKHTDGKWYLSSDLQYKHPDSVFLLSDGHNTMSYSLTWLSGPAPTEWRCKVMDKYDVYTTKYIYSPTYTLSYN